MRTYEGVELWLHASLLAPYRSEWSASCPGCFTPKERAPGTHCVQGWMGSRASMDTMAKKKIPTPAGNQTLFVQPAA